MGWLRRKTTRKRHNLFINGLSIDYWYPPEDAQAVRDRAKNDPYTIVVEPTEEQRKAFLDESKSSPCILGVGKVTGTSKGKGEEKHDP